MDLHCPIPKLPFEQMLNELVKRGYSAPNQRLKEIV